jgi:selenophosphate synthetase-related protein
MRRAELERLAEIVRAAPGLEAKRELSLVAETLAGVSAGLGDDAAAVPDGEGYLLFAAEAIWPPLVATRPFAAGVAAVNANVADLRAMGGRALGIVPTVLARDRAQAEEMLRGLADGAGLLGVSVLGGHLSTGHEPALSAFAWGRARALLSSSAARAGDRVLLASCLEGGYMGELPFFSSLRAGRSPERLAGDGEPLVEIAEGGLCACARDISMPGILGSLLQLLEASGAGATVDVEGIPRPAGVALERWLVTFPSYGFLLCAAPERADAVCEAFRRRELSCAPIGEIDAGRRLLIAAGDERALVWDLAGEPLTGLH